MSKKYYEKLLSDIQNQSKPVESKFGSYILQKFGWEKGKGLGKHENGDVKIIKIKKYGEHGLGYNEHEENDNGMWWENMYNNCAKKINTDNNNNNNNNRTNSSNSNNNSNEKIVRNNENIKYSLFVKKDTCIISPACTSLEQHRQAEDEKINKKEDIKIKNKHINKNENIIHNSKLITNKSGEQNHDEYVKRNKKKKKKKKEKKKT
ncbi:hypothetical protein PGSY75_1110300 [Plasmodium gaboni]|uniref:G-patch domain-containing protein n=1 Tax=Plasmodium gaboni TaxID=647221 RepID=A0A151LID8_9APIC|nr:hypothetical protein PGSY75_1110300 [Plasmodium gaboni]KYN98741.1 hypothetical protein PGSY75_1110300 [Plasmodium gaboni]